MSRGWKRLAIVVTVAWTIVWSATAWLGWQMIQQGNERIAHMPTINQWPLPTAYTEEIARMGEGRDYLAAAMIYGIGIPIVLLVALPIVWWVYSGFKPKA